MYGYFLFLCHSISMYMIHSIIINKYYIIYLHRISTPSHLFSRNNFDRISVSLHDIQWEEEDSFSLTSTSQSMSQQSFNLRLTQNLNGVGDLPRLQSGYLTDIISGILWNSILDLQGETIYQIYPFVWCHLH